MSFRLRELSLFGGEPIGLFRFRRGNLVWRYATGDRPITLGDEVFEAPGGVSRSEIQDSSQNSKNRVTITLPPGLPVADNWVPYPVAGRVFVDCLALHKGEAEFVTEWVGRVVGPKYGRTKLELVCEPSRATSRGAGTNLRWQLGCTVPFYSQGTGLCNRDPLLDAKQGTVDSLSGLTLTSAVLSEFPLGRLEGGFITWIRPDGEPDYRTIMAHLGNSVTLMYGTDALPAGAVFVVNPGCRHDWEDCGSHENQDNYGGARFIPARSPNDGEPVQ